MYSPELPSTNMYCLSALSISLSLCTLALKTIACEILESVNRHRFLLPDLTYYIIKTFCQPTAQDAEVSCTTVQLSAGQMVAQLAANRRCYLRRRCTQAQRPSTSQDVTYPQIEIDMWPGPASGITVFGQQIGPGGLYGPDRLARGAPLKTVFYGFIKVIVSSLRSFSKSQLSSHTH